MSLHAAIARIGAAKAERFPKITLTGLLGVAHPQLSNLFSDPAAFGVAGAGIIGPLLNSQILGFQQEAVEAQARQAAAQYEQTVLTAFREVEDALIAVRTARTRSRSTWTGSAGNAARCSRPASSSATPTAA